MLFLCFPFPQVSYAFLMLSEGLEAILGQGVERILRILGAPSLPAPSLPGPSWGRKGESRNKKKRRKNKTRFFCSGQDDLEQRVYDLETRLENFRGVGALGGAIGIIQKLSDRIGKLEEELQHVKCLIADNTDMLGALQENSPVQIA